MPIWRLEPLDTDDPNWRASTYADEVIVRAPSETIARLAACTQFRILAAKAIGGLVPKCPWEYAEFVSAEVVDDPAWPVEGPVEILHPPNSNHTVAATDWANVRGL